MKKTTLILLFLLTPILIQSQLRKELCGFALNQFNTVPKNELGMPFKSEILDDGYSYDAFYLKNDISLHIIFMYQPNSDLIWSIQVTGTKSETDLGFGGIKMGATEAEIIALFGKPDQIDNIGEYGTQWNYKNLNFSFEVNTDGKLSSIKLDLATSSEMDENKAVTPSLNQLSKALLSDNNTEISRLLAPDIEVRYLNQNYSFQKSFDRELKTDASKVYEIIRKLSKDLDTLDTNDTTMVSSELRLEMRGDIKHVYKIKGHFIKEIVLKYYLGSYVIWEIKG